MDGKDSQHPEAPNGNWQFKPGDIISGSDSGHQPTVPSVSPIKNNSEAQAAYSQRQVSSGATPVEEAQTSQFYASSQDDLPGPEVTWTASEYIAHGKSLEWYVLLGASAFGLAAVIYFVTKDKVSAGAIIVVAILFGLMASRKPRILSYAVEQQGITIGHRFYPFTDFKSFSIIDEGPITSITFMPLRRFMPPLSVYFEPADEQKIVDIISVQLPFLQDDGDAIDRFLRRIRF